MRFFLVPIPGECSPQSCACLPVPPSQFTCSRRTFPWYNLAACRTIVCEAIGKPSLNANLSLVCSLCNLPLLCCRLLMQHSFLNGACLCIVSVRSQLIRKLLGKEFTYYSPQSKTCWAYQHMKPCTDLCVLVSEHVHKPLAPWENKHVDCSDPLPVAALLLSYKTSLALPALHSPDVSKIRSQMMTGLAQTLRLSALIGIITHSYVCALMVLLLYRPYGAAMLLATYDEAGPQLAMIEPSGNSCVSVSKQSFLSID